MEHFADKNDQQVAQLFVKWFGWFRKYQDVIGWVYETYFGCNSYTQVGVFFQDCQLFFLFCISFSILALFLSYFLLL